MISSEDNVTLKPRHRKHMDIGDMMYTTPVISLSAPQLLAVKQFLLSGKHKVDILYIISLSLPIYAPLS